MRYPTSLVLLSWRPDDSYRLLDFRIRLILGLLDASVCAIRPILISRLISRGDSQDKIPKGRGLTDPGIESFKVAIAVETLECSIVGEHSIRHLCEAERSGKTGIEPKIEHFLGCLRPT